MKSIFLWAAFIAVAIFGIAGCGKEESGKKAIVIGVIGKSASNDVFQAAHAGAINAAKELGEKYGADVKIIIRTPTEEKAEDQATAIDELTRQGANGILVSCSEANTLTKAIDRAVAAGVVVVCFDSDAPDSKRLTCYGCDDIVCGNKVGEELAKAMNNKGVVAILSGSQSAPNLANRVKGVQQVLGKLPDIKMVDVGTIYLTTETADAAVAKVDEIQRQHPEITGWAFVGGWPLFAQKALKWPAGSIKVVAVDALPQELPYVKDGYVECLLGQDCYGWGYKGVQILLDKIVNKKDPASTKIVDPLTVVTKANADEYAKSWSKWLKK